MSLHPPHLRGFRISETNEIRLFFSESLRGNPEIRQKFHNSVNTGRKFQRDGANSDVEVVEDLVEGGKLDALGIQEEGEAVHGDLKWMDETIFEVELRNFGKIWGCFQGGQVPGVQLLKNGAGKSDVPQFA
jgi:hypothetical protein